MFTFLKIKTLLTALLTRTSRSLKNAVRVVRHEVLWLVVFATPLYLIKNLVCLYYVNLVYSLWFRFLNKLVYTLTMENLVLYRYFLTVQFIFFLCSQVVLMLYHAVRRFFVDMRYRFSQQIPERVLNFQAQVIIFSGFTCGILLEVGKVPQYLKEGSKMLTNRLFDWTTVFYYTFSLNVQIILGAVSQSRQLRYLVTKPKIRWLFTIDELYFGVAAVYRLAKSLSMVRLQDMYIPEVVELGYPLSWGPKDQLVRSVYDAGSYFFWASHKNLDKTLVPLLQKHHFVPYDLLLSAEQVPTAQLQTVLDWIATASKTGAISREEQLFVTEVLNEIYFAFHDHFRLVVLDQIQTDPFFLMRFFCSDKFRHLVDRPGFDYYYNSDPVYQQTFFPADYVLDLRILERVCEHWQFVKYADQVHSRLVSPYRSEMLPFSSQKNDPKLLAPQYKESSNWATFTERYPFWSLSAWFEENWVCYVQSYIECMVYHWHFVMPTRYIIGNVLHHKEPYFDNLGWGFPIHSLQGVPYQDTFLFPCIIFYTVVAALYICNVASDAVYDPLVYHHWFIEFNLKCQYLLGIDDLTDPEFSESIYWLTVIAIIPYYWIPNQRPYYRRRLKTYSDIEYMRYIRRTARKYQSVDPVDSNQVDYFSWQFFEALSPLLPIRDKQAMATIHSKRYRHHVTFYQQSPFGTHNPGKIYKLWQQKYRRYARHLLTNGLGFLEQDWMFSYYRWEYTLQRYKVFPRPGLNERYTHPEYLREYHRYAEMYVPWKRLVGEKRVDLRYRMSMFWQAGFWRKSEVRAVAERVRPVSVDKIKHQLEYKKMVEQTIKDMLRPTPPRFKVIIEPKKPRFDTSFFQVKHPSQPVPKYFKSELQPPFTTLQKFWLTVGKKVIPHVKFEKEVPSGISRTYENPLAVKVQVIQLDKTPQKWLDAVTNPRHGGARRQGSQFKFYLDDLFSHGDSDALKQFYPFPKFFEEHDLVGRDKYTIQTNMILSQQYGQLSRSVYKFFHFLKCLPPVLQLDPTAGDALMQHEGEVTRLNVLNEIRKVSKVLEDYKTAKPIYLMEAYDEWHETMQPKQQQHKPLIPYLFTAPTFAPGDLFEKDIVPLLQVTDNVRTRKKERTQLMTQAIGEFNRILQRSDEVTRKFQKRSRSLFGSTKKIKVERFEPRKLLNDVNLVFFTEEVISPPFGTEVVDNRDIKIKHERGIIQLSVGHIGWDNFNDPEKTVVQYFQPNKEKPYIAQDGTFVVRSVPAHQVYYSLPNLWQRVLNYFIYHPLYRVKRKIVGFYFGTIRRAVRKFPYFLKRHAHDLMIYPFGVYKEETVSQYLRRNRWESASIVMDSYEWSSIYGSFMEAMYGSRSYMPKRNCKLSGFDKGVPTKELLPEFDKDEEFLDDLLLSRDVRLNKTLRNRNFWVTSYFRPGITREDLLERLYYQPIRALAIPAHAFEFTQKQQMVALEDWYDFDNYFFQQSSVWQNLIRGSFLVDQLGDWWHENELEQPLKMSLQPLNSPRVRKSGTDEYMFEWHYLDKLRTYGVFQPITQELVKAFLNPLQTERYPNLRPVDSDLVYRRMFVGSRIHTRAQPSQMSVKRTQPTSVTINSPLALFEQVNSSDSYEYQVGQHLRHRINYQIQQGIGNAYWRLLRQWSQPNNKREFSLRYWLRITPEMDEYFNLHQDRIRFLKNMNLSFPTSNLERHQIARTHDWSNFSDTYYRLDQYKTFRQRQWQNLRNRQELIRFKKDKDDPKSKERGNIHMNNYYRQMYLRFFAPGAFWDSYFANKYAAGKPRVKVPGHTVPKGRLIHIFEAMQHIKDPSERLDLAFKLFEQHNVTKDHPAMMDFFFNDLYQTIEAYYREKPRLTENDNLSALSLPGTIVSPREIRQYWSDFKSFNKKTHKLVEFYNYLSAATGLRDLRKMDPAYTYYNTDEPIKYHRNGFQVPKTNVHETVCWYPYPVDSTDLTDWNKWSWLFGCTGMVESEQIAFYRFWRTPVEDFWDAGMKYWKEKNRKKRQKPDIPTVSQDVLVADLEQFPFFKSFDEKIAPYIEYSASLLSVPGLEHDLLLDPRVSTAFYPFPTGYLRANVTVEEDRTVSEYLKYTNALGLRGDRKATWRMLSRNNPRYSQTVMRMKNHLDKHNSIELAANPIIFADTPDSFAEYSSKEYIFDIEQRRIRNRFLWRLHLDFEPKFQKYLRDNKTRKVFFTKHFSYFFDMIRKDWLHVTITPGLADEIMKDLLLPELEILRSQIVKQGTPLTTPKIHNYRTAYIFDVVPSLIDVYEEKELVRQQAELQLLEDMEQVKENYKGRYYTQLRETMLEPLSDRLKWLDDERYTETSKDFWHKGSYVWETRILADWFITMDTLNEIETRDPLMQLENDSWVKTAPLSFLGFADFSVSDYGYTFQDQYGPSLNYWRYLTDVFCQDWDEYPERFPVRRYTSTPYIEYRNSVNDLMWLPRNKKAVNVLQRTENHNLWEYTHQISWRFFNRGHFGDQLLERARYTYALGDLTSFFGQTAWLATFDTLRPYARSTGWETEGPTFRIEYFTPLRYWHPWYSTRDTISRLKNDYLLVGLYNVTQLAPTPIQFFTQTRSGGYGGAVDLFGIQCDASTGRAPYEWYDLYDPISNRVIEVLPNFQFIFKEGKMFRRYFGYYMPQTIWERVIGPWSIVDNIESITSGYTDLESRVGVELAVTQTLFRYFGILPHNVIEFLTYATYWGYTWVNAIYNGSFVESHIEKLAMMTPQDGLLELGVTGREYELCLRQMQLKILQCPDIDYDKIFADLLRAQELRICNTYFFGYFPYSRNP